MQTAFSEITTDLTTCNKISGYKLTTLLLRNGKKLGLTPTELLVFSTLATYWNGKPIYPRLTTLAEDTALSDKAIRNNLNNLITKGFIIKSKRGKNANVYNINLKKVLNAVESGTKDHTRPVRDTAPCTKKLDHEKLDQQHGVVVSFQNFSKGVEEETCKGTSRTADSVSSETQQQEYPLCIIRGFESGKIRNIKKYWGSLRPQVKEEYWQQDRAEAEAEARKQEKKRLEAEEKARKEAEERKRREELARPIEQQYSREQAIRVLYNMRNFTRNIETSMWYPLVKHYKLDLASIYAMSKEDIENLS